MDYKRLAYLAMNEALRRHAATSMLEVSRQVMYQDKGRWMVGPTLAEYGVPIIPEDKVPHAMAGIFAAIREWERRKKID